MEFRQFRHFAQTLQDLFTGGSRTPRTLHKTSLPPRPRGWLAPHCQGSFRLPLGLVFDVSLPSRCVLLFPKQDHSPSREDQPTQLDGVDNGHDLQFVPGKIKEFLEGENEIRKVWRRNGQQQAQQEKD